MSDLRLVNPCRTYNGKESRKMALKAEIILESAVVYDELESAIADCRISLGTTRRMGKYREDYLEPERAAEKISIQGEDCRVALVFGREDRGLLTEELDLCQMLVTINTHDDFSSMNLAQSVAVCLYEFSKWLDSDMVENRKKPIKPCENRKLEAMFMHMRKTFLDIDFSDPLNPDHIVRTFRRIFGRTTLNDRDVRVLQGLLSRIDWIEGQRKKMASILNSEPPSDRFQS
jgi:tRNA/rRNA methyltransferase